VLRRVRAVQPEGSRGVIGMLIGWLIGREIGRTVGTEYGRRRADEIAWKIATALDQQAQHDEEVSK